MLIKKNGSWSNRFLYFTERVRSRTLWPLRRRRSQRQAKATRRCWTSWSEHWHCWPSSSRRRVRSPICLPIRTDRRWPVNLTRQFSRWNTKSNRAREWSTCLSWYFGPRPSWTKRTLNIPKWATWLPRLLIQNNCSIQRRGNEKNYNIWILCKPLITIS